MEQDRLLWDVKQAGFALGLSHWTIRKMAKDGTIQTVRLGRRVLIEPAECRRLVKAGREKQPSPERIDS